MDEKNSVQEPKSVEKELLLLDLRRIFWLAPLGLLLTFALLATMHFLKRDLTLEGFSLIDFKNPSFEQIWADAVNIVPEDFDPLTWLLTFLTFDVAIVVVIVMDGKSRIKGTIELFFLGIHRHFHRYTVSHGYALSLPYGSEWYFHRFGLYPVHLGLGMHLGECQ